jgi:hypothetical protein
MPERITMFEEFWNAWPKSTRKGGKAQCKAKWDKLKLDLQADQIIKHVEWMKTTDQWKKGDGAFIPSPLVYINQMRWDGAEIPDMTVNVNVNLRDPALAKIEEDTRNVAPMPSFVREYIAKLRGK